MQKEIDLGIHEPAAAFGVAMAAALTTGASTSARFVCETISADVSGKLVGLNRDKSGNVYAVFDTKEGQYKVGIEKLEELTRELKLPFLCGIGEFEEARRIANPELIEGLGIIDEIRSLSKYLSRLLKKEWLIVKSAELSAAPVENLAQLGTAAPALMPKVAELKRSVNNVSVGATIT